MNRASIARGAVVALLGVGIPGRAVEAQPATPTVPSNFVTTIDNPYFPLTPGTIFIYRGSEEGTKLRDVVTVTNKTKTVMGVECVDVLDVVYEDGEEAERTHDWYAQDADGNVWYFGEDSATIENGKVKSREGSWEAGVDGAMPGIIMPAEPTFGRPYQQEYYPGNAEDMAVAVMQTDGVEVPAGTYDKVLVTREWSPIEPGVAEDKLYAPGIGEILEQGIEGSTERLELVEIRTGAATPAATPGA